VGASTVAIVTLSQAAVSAPATHAGDEGDSARPWLRDTAFKVARQLGAFDCQDLLSYARDLERHQPLGRCGIVDRLQVALPLSLVRPLRLLAVTGSGPRRVSKLPFDKVLAAANACADLYIPGEAGVDYPVEQGHRRSSLGPPALSSRFGVRTLREWREQHGMRPWLVDVAVWNRAVDVARSTVSVVGIDEVAAQLLGRLVESAEPRPVAGGPRDGSPGMELIFDNGQAVQIPASNEEDGAALVGGRMMPMTVRGKRPVLVFAAHNRRPVILPVADSGALALQPSPIVDFSDLVYSV
jgi:hypothetical protein